MPEVALRVLPQFNAVAVSYDGVMMLPELGVGIPLDGQWLWSSDGSLRVIEQAAASGRDAWGDYSAIILTYADAAGPLVDLACRLYPARSCVAVSATARRDLEGLRLEDSFFRTTFNAPIARLGDGLRLLTYLWGLRGGEGVGVSGHWPDAVTAPGLAALPDALRVAGFSPTNNQRNNTPDKPFAPLVAYDSQERTLVMSPLNHFLISPLRVIQTPGGLGVARGLHGSVNRLPAGAATETLLVFGQGLSSALRKWGDLLLERGGKKRGQGRDNPLLRSLGYWNCYGGYYAELFRQMDAATLRELAAWFDQEGLPVRYWGLDLWYHFGEVGFARDYQPDAAKYPDGLAALRRDTGRPFLLHMSAFDPATSYCQQYPFVTDEGSCYPTGPGFFRDRAREFAAWGGLGVWPDFLRTQLQNSHSLRETPGGADRLFDHMAEGMAGQGLGVMLCMPTVGHYLASTRHPNVIAARTSTDYVNHQPGQLEMLRHIGEFKTQYPPARNTRQNLLVGLLADAVGLAPSCDVFISNVQHPEGFGDLNVWREALLRALSAGVVGFGDKVGCADKTVLARLAFPDGTLSQPDHPPHVIAATLHTDTLAFATETTVSGHTWQHIAVFNVGESEGEYSLSLVPWLPDAAAPVYDCLAGRLLGSALIPAGGELERGNTALLQGRLPSGGARHVMIPPVVGGLALLGFLDKHIPVSGRQALSMAGEEGWATLELALPPGHVYAFAFTAPGPVAASGAGLQVLGVAPAGEGIAAARFRVEQLPCRLTLRLA